MTTGIYKFTSPTGKIYIGSSINIEKRIRYYKYMNCQGQVKFFNSLKKHGYAAHKFEVLEICSPSKLYERERHYGELYDVLGKNGLSLILPNNGENKVGVSESTRVKMSLSKQGSRNTFFGKTHSAETRELISIAQKGRKHSEEHRAKVSQNSARINSKLVVDIETGIFYDSIKEAAFAKGVIHSSLKSRVNGSSRTYTPIRVA